MIRYVKTKKSASTATAGLREVVFVPLVRGAILSALSPTAVSTMLKSVYLCEGVPITCRAPRVPFPLIRGMAQVRLWLTPMAHLNLHRLCILPCIARERLPLCHVPTNRMRMKMKTTFCRHLSIHRCLLNVDHCPIRQVTLTRTQRLSPGSPPRSSGRPHCTVHKVLRQ